MSDLKQRCVQGVTDEQLQKRLVKVYKNNIPNTPPPSFSKETCYKLLSSAMFICLKKDLFRHKSIDVSQPRTKAAVNVINLTCLNEHNTCWKHHGYH